jgi:carbonic anhydrase
MVDSCSCLAQQRRAVLGIAAAGLVTATLKPVLSWAVDKPAYEAMLLSCIDPRMVDPVHGYMNGRGLDRRYSQFVFAGAAIGVKAPAFASWRPAFWDNLATSIELHRVSRLIAIDHRDCGAAKIAYGADSIATPQVETETHRRVLMTFKAEVARRYPKLQVEGLLMDLDGNVQVLA